MTQLYPPGSLDGENIDECTSLNGKGNKKELLWCVFYLSNVAVGFPVVLLTGAA